MARREYKKMKALMTMIKVYRQKKFREYICLLDLRFKGVKRMKDLGKSLIWPKPPSLLRDTAKTLRNIFNKWRAYMILSKIPPSEYPQMRLKITAASYFINKRAFYGVNRKWEGKI